MIGNEFRDFLQHASILSEFSRRPGLDPGLEHLAGESKLAMAILAIREAGNRIVAGRRVLHMAIDALIRSSSIDSVRVALGAGQSSMHAPQWKERHRMAEVCVLPERLPMALAAVRERAAVNVVFLVTDQTLLAQSTQFTRVFVTLGAGQSVVHAMEREVLVEILGRMPAAFAVTVFTARSERSVMRIAMAARAFHRHRLIPNQWPLRLREFDELIAHRSVTGAAFDVAVLVLEEELTVGIVIERRGFPIFFAVALRARRAELSLVIIGMARGTGFFREFREKIFAHRRMWFFGERFVRRRMAIRTIEFGVRIQQFERRRVVVERRRRGPFFGRVAFGAALRVKLLVELLFVRVLMAVDTEFFLKRCESENLFLLDQVARIAGGSHVRAGEREAGFLVLEVLLILVQAPALGDVALGTFFGEHRGRENTDVRALVAILASFLIELSPMINRTKRRLEFGDHALDLARADDVALFTANICVAAVDRVPGVERMVEFVDVFPLGFAMAGAAIIELAEAFQLGGAKDVIVGVTAQTATRQAGPFVEFHSGLHDLGLLNVALHAIDFGVFAA